MRQFLVGLAAFLLVAVALTAAAEAAIRGPAPAWSGSLLSATAVGLSCNVQAPGTCTPFENNASTNRSRVLVLNVSNFTNAHAEKSPLTPAYSLGLCCWGQPYLTSSCALSGTDRPVNISGDPDVHDAVVILSNRTNAHVEQYPVPVGTQNYNINACIGVGKVPSTAGNTIVSDCQYATSCGSLGTGYSCVATVSNATNAHIGNNYGSCAGASDYATKICCKVVSDDTPPAPLRVSPSAACGSIVQQSGNFTYVNYTASLVGPLQACELEWANRTGVYRIDMTVQGGGTGHYCFYNQTDVFESRLAPSYYWYRVRMEDRFANFNWTANCTLQVNLDVSPP